MAPEAGPPGGSIRRSVALAWLWGALLLGVLILVVVGHAGEARRFAALARDARPTWLAVSALLQLATYVCAAAVWHRALRGAEARPPLWRLVPLGLAKLFTDQAVPSAGMSGTILVVRALSRRGISRGRAVAAMLVGLAAFYLAYAVVVAAALIALWKLGQLDPILLVLATLLGFLAGAVPAGIFGLGRRLAGRLPPVLMRIPVLREAAEEFAEASPGSLFQPRLAVETVALQVGVFLLDAATLVAMLHALATPVPLSVAFAAFVFASVVATLAWVPGGLGTFEGTCVAMLSSHGVSAEAALAATLLLRGFSFWLPMLPGLWFARREMAGSPAPPEGGGGGSPGSVIRELPPRLERPR